LCHFLNSLSRFASRAHNTRQLFFNSRNENTTTSEPEITMAEPVKERTVEVVAPSNLAGGYEFFVHAGNNISYKVRVPVGGMVAGQRFNAVILSEASAGGAHSVPFERWRDGLCDCCAFGCCHPVCCLTLWCYPCSLGQVLHRMKLNFCAKTRADGKYPATSAFKVFFGIVNAVYVLQFIVWILITSSSDDPGTTTSVISTGLVRSSALPWLCSALLSPCACSRTSANFTASLALAAKIAAARSGACSAPFANSIATRRISRHIAPVAARIMGSARVHPTWYKESRKLCSKRAV
jgi:hypothetical protein